jgi:hypothetical protein
MIPSYTFFDSGLADKEVLIFFDWDDTLLPTTFLRDFFSATDFDDILRGERQHEFIAQLSTQPWSEAMKSYTLLVKKCLEKCAEVATIVIMTLSKHQWVQRSAEVFMPELSPILNKTKIVYARESWKSATREMGNRMFRTPSLAKPAEYDMSFFVNLKAKAFESVITDAYSRKSLPRNAWATVLSIGDSMIECLACKEAAWILPCVACCKTIKFMNTPNLQQLWVEIETVMRNIKQVVRMESRKNMMMQLSMNKTLGCALIQHRF